MAPSIPKVHGLDVDPQTRCAHYHKPADVIAIKMHCCGLFYACKDCHDALAGHGISVWPKSEWQEHAILCGACGNTLSIEGYLDCDSRCPVCGARFNPGCRNHHHFYFEMAPASA
jgi:uncharacterized CHY-type Zn-finger protein